MKIVGIYLAVGNSSRMGENKLALSIGTKKLGSLALETAMKTALDKIYVITKEMDDVNWLSPNVKMNPKIAIVECPAAHEGQSESLRCGIKEAQSNQADAAVVLLADQPFITTLLIDEMITCMKETPSRKFIAASHEQKIMPPVLFSASMFPSLLNLTGDNGAKELLRGEFLQDGKQLPCADKRLVFDVNTKEDYAQLLSIFGK